MFIQKILNIYIQTKNILVQTINKYKTILFQKTLPNLKHF